MLTLAFIQGSQWVIVILVIVLLFGATKIPQLARSLGRAKSEFQKGTLEGEKDLVSDEDAQVRQAAKDLGIPTDGRPLEEVKADLRTKLG